MKDYNDWTDKTQPEKVDSVLAAFDSAAVISPSDKSLFYTIFSTAPEHLSKYLDEIASSAACVLVLLSDRKALILWKDSA